MNPSSKTRCVIFDCDGTLVDGQASICEAMETAFAGADLAPPSRNAIRRIVGLSLPQALRELVPDASDRQRAVVVDGYKSAFFAARTEGRLHEPLFDGMEDLLRRLHSGGRTLGVATGKSDRGLVSCLRSHGIADLFVTLQTADRHPSKPHPAMPEAALVDAGVAPAEAVMIGDTSFDMEMAVAAGVLVIASRNPVHSVLFLILAFLYKPDGFAQIELMPLHKIAGQFSHGNRSLAIPVHDAHFRLGEQIDPHLVVFASSRCGQDRDFSARRLAPQVGAIALFVVLDLHLQPVKFPLPFPHLGAHLAQLVDPFIKILHLGGELGGEFPVLRPLSLR